MENSPTLRNPALQLALALAVSATVGVFVVEAGIDPLTTVFWRCAFGATFLFLWNLAFGHLKGGGFMWRNLIFAAAAGCLLALCWVCLFAAFRMTSIGTATIVFQSYPFLLILAGWLVWRERVTVEQLAWIVLAFAGVALASGALAAPAFTGGQWVQGLGLTLLAAACYVGVTVLVRAIRGQRAEVTMMIQASVGAVLLAFGADFHQAISARSWAWLAGIGVIHSGLVMVAMYATFPLLPTPRIAILNFVYPAVAILLDWFIYRHPLTLVQLAGVALIVLATLGANLGWRLPGLARKTG
ncbi:DMT family transporter [Aestuariivirga sp.]|uniref:DMT family transporter n=1 Tax=Aestuariivirga sp. TaxID=2650926 RepID=UPI0039E32977